MAKLTRLNSEDRENLAAYLDGELDDDTTRRIEAVLTASEVARNDVDLLARTYDMLDLLPRPKASSDFTQKTVATAKLEGYRKPLTQQPWFRNLRQVGIFAAYGGAMLLCGVLGYAATNQWIPQQDDLLLQQLPLIQNLDAYLEAGDIEFVRDLAAQKQLLNDIQRSTSR